MFLNSSQIIDRYQKLCDTKGCLCWYLITSCHECVTAAIQPATPYHNSSFRK